jgi:threonine aldolase
VVATAMLNGYLDYRSDTITQPTDGMWESMRRAPLGDDGWGDDETVNALEAKVAELVGKESSLFVVSGTQANLLALLAHEVRGREVILDPASHIFNGELGNISTVAGAIPRTIRSSAGIMDLDLIEQAIRHQNGHYAGTGLVTIENTHNRSGGRIWSIEDLQALASLAARHGIPVHMDGARIFNAAARLEMTVRDISAHADSLSFCLSKGLGAPVGSLLCGSKLFIQRARSYRTMLGGTMRQAGVLAAAGVYALDHHVERLKDDHRRAQMLVQGLAQISALSVDPAAVETNMMEVILPTPLEISGKITSRLQAQKIRFGMRGPLSMRLVTHLHVTDADIDVTVEAFDRACADHG